MENLSPEERTLIVSALQNSNDVHNETNVRDNNAPQMVEERRGLGAYNLRNPTVLPVIYINAETDDKPIKNTSNGGQITCMYTLQKEYHVGGYLCLNKRKDYLLC